MEEMNDQHIKGVRRELFWHFNPRVEYFHLFRANFLPPICLLMRQTAIDKIGYFNENLPVLGDWDYNLRLLQIGDIGVISEELAYYHIRMRSEEKTAYGNSVQDRNNEHEIYNALFKNSLIRARIGKAPKLTGIYTALAMNQNEIVADIFI